MEYEVKSLPVFDRRFKRLAKKYKSLPAELKLLINELKLHPNLGLPLGANLFKIRMSNHEKGRGKSGGFRLITFYLQSATPVQIVIYLVTIYDKSEEDNVSKGSLLQLVKKYL